MKKHYRPLPSYLTIKPSKIEGLGLFSTCAISKGTNLGITHIKDEIFEDEHSRTPLGGFINHSKKPNCKLADFGDEMHLYTLRDIKEGEELTLLYHLYDPVEIIDER